MTLALMSYFISIFLSKSYLGQFINFSHTSTLGLIVLSNAFQTGPSLQVAVTVKYLSGIDIKCPPVWNAEKEGHKFGINVEIMPSGNGLAWNVELV